MNEYWQDKEWIYGASETSLQTALLEAANKVEALEAAIIGLLVAADDIPEDAFKENWDVARDKVHAALGILQSIAQTKES